MDGERNWRKPKRSKLRKQKKPKISKATKKRRPSKRTK